MTDRPQRRVGSLLQGKVRRNDAGGAADQHGLGAELYLLLEGLGSRADLASPAANDPFGDPSRNSTGGRSGESGRNSE